MQSAQYGGLQGRKAQTVTLLEELQFDYLLLTQAPYSNLDSNRTAHYHQILMPISRMASRGFGIHQDLISEHAQAQLEEATYKLKISNLITEEGYKHIVKIPIYRSDQGVANPPAVWGFISSKLFAAHKHQNHMDFCSSDRKAI